MAQVILKCQLCQMTIKNIKWKCYECQILICDNCKTNIHPRVKTPIIHTIVGIKDIDFSKVTQQPPIDLQSIPCKNHPKNMCCVYCVKCEDLICAKCLTKSHQGHKIDEIENIYKERLQFVRDHFCRNVDPKAYSIIFSSFQESNVNSIPADLSFTVVKTFITDLPFIHRLSTTSHNSAWLSCWPTKALNLVQFDPELVIIKEFVCAVNDMTLDRPSDILLTLTGDTKLYRLKDSREMVIEHDFKDLIPLAVAISGKTLLVSTKDRGPVLPLTDKSRRQIVTIYSRKQKVIEYDINKSRLFTNPWRITPNKNGDIVVVDVLTPDTGRIIGVVDHSIRWTYNGNLNINTKARPFYPFDIVTTDIGNILVAHRKAHILHVVSCDGILIKHFVTEDIQIEEPTSFDIDMKGRLWIGCYTKEGAMDAKFHIVEFTGC